MTLQPALPVWLLIATGVLVITASVLGLRGRHTEIGLLGRRWVLVTAVLLLSGALLRPVIGGSEQAVSRVAGDRDPNVFLVVDRSPDMAGPSMEQARNDIEALIDRYPDARFAVIGFADRPSLEWPLSADTWSLRPMAASIDADAAAPADTANAGAAATVLRYQLIGATQQFPRARNLVFYLGSGTPGSIFPAREFALSENSVDGGAVLGYGTGGAQTLRAVADQLGVPYVPREPDGSVDDQLDTDAATAGEPAASRQPASGWELYWVLSGAAAVLLLGALYHALREVRRTRLDREEVGR
ncbi:VWA domain-containing protein [Mycolicibacterium sp. 22603]|uniref:VWA domain-containing protein n=1 Tax=Mycolicibacterium sp. 22603 TaxID=3453950 RepID=UPI003F865508